MKRLILAVGLALSLVAGIAAADGPVLWKQHCPRHYEFQFVPDKDGVTVLCIRAARNEQ